MKALPSERVEEAGPASGELKRKVEVVSLGSEDEEYEELRAGEVIQISDTPKKGIQIVSLGSEEDIGEAEVIKAFHRQSRRPVVLSHSYESNEGDEYYGDE